MCAVRGEIEVRPREGVGEEERVSQSNFHCERGGDHVGQ